MGKLRQVYGTHKLGAPQKKRKIGDAAEAPCSTTMKVEQKAIDDSDLVGDDDEIEIGNACNDESGRAEKVADEVEFVKTAAQLRNLSGTSVLNCALSALRCDRIRIRTKMILLVADEMKKSFDICLGLKTKNGI